MKGTRKIKTMKYGVKVFANGREIISKLCDTKEEAQIIVNAYKKNFNVYRFLVEENGLAKVVRQF